MKASKLFFKIVNSKKGTYIMYIAIFLAIFLGNLKSFTGETKSLYYVEPTIAIIDEDKSQLSTNLKSYLESRYKTQEVEADEDKIKDKVFAKSIHYVIRMHEGFEESIKTDDQKYKGYSGSEASVNRLIEYDVQQYLTYYNLYEISLGGEIPEEKMDWVQGEIQNISSQEVDGKVLGSDENATNKLTTMYYFLSFLIYILIAIGFASVGVTIVLMERRSVKIRDLVSGYPAWMRSKSIFFSSLIWMSLIWLLMIIVGLTATGFEILQNSRALLMIVSSFVHVISITLIIILLANMIQSDRVMALASTLFSLIVAFSSGIFVPRELMIKELVLFSKIFPAHWDINNLQLLAFDTTLGQAEYRSFFVNLAIMLLMGVAAGILNLILNRSRERSE